MFMKLKITVHLAVSSNWLVFKLPSIFFVIFLEPILRKQMFPLKPLKDYQHSIPSKMNTLRLATNFNVRKQVLTQNHAIV